MKAFTLLYYGVSLLLYVIGLPLIVFLALKPKYRESIPARFFLFKNPSFSTSNAIWFHVCSLGETRALKAIVNHLEDTPLLITTITRTGYAEASKYDAEVRYLPYEMFLPFWVKKQKILVVLEAEFWYLLFVLASARGAKVVLLNARISDKSVKKYLQFAWFYKKLLSYVDIVYAQSEVDKNRFLALGAKDIEVIGNIKLAGEIKHSKEYDKPEMMTIVAGSTHEGEEKSILANFIKFRRERLSKLIVVPRHPERFDGVYRLLKEGAKDNGLNLSLFSELANFDADIILVDKMGELNNIYRISDIAILGGAFREDVGGHNPLEPAHFGCKIITGKHFFHQKELFKYLHHVQYVESSEIYEALNNAENLPPSMVEEKIDLQPIVNTIKDTYYGFRKSI